MEKSKLVYKVLNNNNRNIRKLPFKTPKFKLYNSIYFALLQFLFKRSKSPVFSL